MSGSFESDFARSNFIQGIQDQQSIPRADIIAGFAAIDAAISNAQGSYEVSDNPTQIGMVAFHDDGRLVIASHKIVAPNETLPGVPVAQTGSVISYNLHRHEPANPANKDQDGWSLYLPEQNQGGQPGKGQAWEQRAGRRRDIPFAVGQLVGTLEMAQRFGVVVSQDEARRLLGNDR